MSIWNQEKDGASGTDLTAIGMMGEVLRRAHEASKAASSNKTVRNAAIAAGASAVTAAGVTAYAIWRKRRNDSRMVLTEETEPITPLFSDESLPEASRWYLAQVAARVYDATFETEGCVITEDALQKQLGGDLRDLRKSLKRLQDEALIDTRLSLLDGKTTGYFALLGLVDAVEIGPQSPLHQAVFELQQQN